MRAVLDVNVLVSFLLTHGPTISTILSAWKKGTFSLLVSDEILLEVQQVVTRFVISGMVDKEEAQALVRRLKKQSVIVGVTSSVTASPDKKDNRYLSCAKDGKANFLVTGDKGDLLRLGNFEGTKIISPKEFVELLNE